MEIESEIKGDTIRRMLVRVNHDIVHGHEGGYLVVWKIPAKRWY